MVPPNSQAACWYLMFRDLLFRDCMIHSAQVLESVRDRGCHVFTASLLKLEHSSFQSPIKLYNPWFLSSLQEEGDKSWLIVALSWLPITPILLLIPLTNISRAPVLCRAPSRHREFSSEETDKAIVRQGSQSINK